MLLICILLSIYNQNSSVRMSACMFVSYTRRSYTGGSTVHVCLPESECSEHDKTVSPSMKSSLSGRGG